MKKILLILGTATIVFVIAVPIYVKNFNKSTSSPGTAEETSITEDGDSSVTSNDEKSEESIEITSPLSSTSRSSSFFSSSVLSLINTVNTSLVTESPDVSDELNPIGRYRNLVFGNVTSQKDITYKSTYRTKLTADGEGYVLDDDLSNPKDLKLNIYQPIGDSQTVRPLLIFVYGGGWILGDRYQQEEAAIDFAKRGYVTITIDYTMFPEDNELNPVPDPNGTVYPRLIFKSATNIYEAYQWALQNKTEYRIDETRIGLGGWSAGGLISQALGHVESLPEPIGVKAILGLSNILPANVSSAPPLNGYRTFDSTFSPTSMFASYQDDEGFAGTYNDHEEDCAYLDSIGHECITTTYPGAGHDLFYDQAPAQADAVNFFATYVTGH